MQGPVCRKSGLDSVAGRLHQRRGLLGRFAASGAAAMGAALGVRRRATAQGDEVACRIVGVTGGGVIRTTGSDITLVLFASRFVEGDGQPAEGKVRWLDPSFDGGLSLESTGAIVYQDVDGDERSREVRGIASVNGEFEAPFVLLVTDNTVEGSTESPPDRCVIQAGNLIGDTGTPTSGGWGYAAEGELIGGDLLLIGEADS
jgi:hypothetical protein